MAHHCAQSHIVHRPFPAQRRPPRFRGTILLPVLIVFALLLCSSPARAQSPLDFVEDIPPELMLAPSTPRNFTALGHTYQYVTLPWAEKKSFVPFVARKNADGSLAPITAPDEFKAVLAYAHLLANRDNMTPIVLRQMAEKWEQAADEVDPSQADPAIVCLSASKTLFGLGVTVLFADPTAPVSALVSLGNLLTLGEFMINTVQDILDYSPESFEMAQALHAISTFSPQGLNLPSSRYAQLQSYVVQGCPLVLNGVELAKSDLDVFGILFDKSDQVVNSLGHSIDDIIANPQNYSETIRNMPWHKPHAMLGETTGLFGEAIANYAISRTIGPLHDLGNEWKIILGLAQVHYNTAAMLARHAADEMAAMSSAGSPGELRRLVDGLTGSMAAISAMNRVLYEGMAVIYKRLYRLNEQPMQSLTISDTDVDQASAAMSTVWGWQQDFQKKVDTHSDGMELLISAYGIPDEGAVVPTPSINVTAPEAGALEEGEQVAIAWDATGLAANVDVHLTTDGGSSWQLLGSVPATAGALSWTVPASYSQSCRIRVRSSLNAEIADTGPTFSIRAPCAPHSLSIFQSGLTGSVLDYDDSAAVTIHTRNLLPNAETVTPRLSVEGPGGYSAAKTQTSFTLGANASDATGRTLTWTPGSGGWPSVNTDGYYVLTATVESLAGCDFDYSDNSVSYSVYVTQDGTPPSHKAFSISMHELDEDHVYTISGHSFEFSNYDDGEAKIYVDGDRFYLDKDEGRFTDDLQVVFWWHRVVHSIPSVMHLFVGTASDSNALSPYQVSVTRGESAVFADPRGYDDGETFVVTGDDDEPDFDASTESSLDFSDSGSVITVDTTYASVGTHRFAIATDMPSSSNDTEYLAFGRVDVVAPRHVLNVAATGNGSGTVRINGTLTSLPHGADYAEGTSLTLTAIPASGSAFTGWSGASTSTNPTITVSMDAAKSLGAQFDRRVALDLTRSGSGSVKVDGSAVSLPYQGTFGYGQSVQLTAEPAEGWTFAGWSDGSAIQTDAQITVQLAEDGAFEAMFKRLYTLTLSITGGGTVLVNGVPRTDGQTVQIQDGDTISLKATPDQGMAFADWGGTLAGSGGETSLAISGDVSINAGFEAITPILTVVASPSTGGSVNVSPAPGSGGTYTWSGTVTLTATPNPSFEFLYWTGDASGALATTQIVMDADKIASARFRAIVQDSDGDGVPDNIDAFPTDPAESVDTDHDGIGNNADPDDDGDGMPDTWELANNLDPLLTDAGLDPDEDDLTNLQEYQQGSDPHINNSKNTAGAISAIVTTLLLENTPVTQGRLAFCSNQAGEQDIWTATLNLDGTTTGLTNLTADLPGNSQEPDWSPDGQRIAFRNEYDIWVMNADGTGKTRLTPSSTYYDLWPHWSPNGGRIVFTRITGMSTCTAYRTTRIGIINPDGSGYTEIPNISGHGLYHPSWSPDGTRLIYNRDEGSCANPRDIYIMNADGSGRTLVFPNPGGDWEYQWFQTWGRKGRILYANHNFTGSEDFIGILEPDGTSLGTYHQPNATTMRACTWAFDDTRVIFESQLPGENARRLRMIGADLDSEPVTIVNLDSFSATGADFHQD